MAGQYLALGPENLQVAGLAKIKTQLPMLGRLLIPARPREQESQLRVPGPWQRPARFTVPILCTCYSSTMRSGFSVSRRCFHFVLTAARQARSPKSWDKCANSSESERTQATNITALPIEHQGPSRSTTTPSARAFSLAAVYNHTGTIPEVTDMPHSFAKCLCVHLARSSNSAPMMRS